MVESSVVLVYKRFYGGVAYTREQVLSFIEQDVLTDEDVLITCPEVSTILQMFKTDKATKVVEEYIRQVL